MAAENLYCEIEEGHKIEKGVQQKTACQISYYQTRSRLVWLFTKTSLILTQSDIDGAAANLVRIEDWRFGRYIRVEEKTAALLMRKGNIFDPRGIYYEK